MHKILSLFFIITLFPVPVQAQSNSPVEEQETFCAADLPQKIGTIINHPNFARSRWGIRIQTRDRETPLYSLDAAKYFTPASSTKVLTTAAALHRLGPDFRIETPLHLQGTSPTLDQLRIIGQGDPSLTTEDLNTVVQQLRDRNIEEINTLILEDSTPPYALRGETWEIYDVNFYYAMPVNRLILNENTFKITFYPRLPGETVHIKTEDEIALQQWEIINQGITAPSETPLTLEINGEVGKPTLYVIGEMSTTEIPYAWYMSILHPKEYFRDTFISLLKAEGITVNNSEITLESNPSLTPTDTLTLTSPPLSELIQETNQSSNNLYAESLVSHIGGISALEESLTELGVTPNSYHLEGGSGLSRHTLLSPLAVVETLNGIAKSPHFDVFLASLPIGGESGTLRGRFKDTPLEGQVQAKTGTLTGASSLSGYLDPPNYPPLTFSIMVNRSERPISEQRAAIDDILMELWYLKEEGCHKT